MSRKSHPNHFQRNKYVKFQENHSFFNDVFKSRHFCNSVKLVLTLITTELREIDVDNVEVKTLHGTLISHI